LDTYSANSGKLVSVSKLSIFFSPNTNVLVKAKICETLNINTEAISNKYLGLPTFVGADKSECFLHFVEIIIQRITGWKEKMLSKAGKEVIIKACAQAIPKFTMVCFDITKSLCDQISSMVCRLVVLYAE
jgi:hypothetical protein